MDFQRSNSQLPMSSGLTRYRSAPSSYFSTFLDAVDDAIRNDGAGGAGDDFNSFLDRFMPSNIIRTQGQGSNCLSNTVSLQSQSQFVAPMKQEQDVFPLPPPPQQQGNQSNYPLASPVMHRNQGQTQPQAQLSQLRNTNLVGSNRLAAPMKMGTGGENSNLIRYNSSPAGLFADINIENEYGAIRGMGNFGAGNNSANATSFHGDPVDFSSAQSSHSGLMPLISETNPGDTSFGENQKIDSNYMSGFPVTSWDDSAIISDSFLKGIGDDDHDDNANKPLLSNLGEMNNEGSKRPRTLLSHHLSLPKTSDELPSMETLMQDSVLCKLRAKRGCATHPRSIAERVRRTRISERMRKLQDLVPNMDKQTNTSDMLDLAVDYIKDLQKQLQTLTDNRAKCTCLN